MQDDRRALWNARHAEAAEIGAPAQVLSENLHLLPPHGDALDLACGRGANALVLAQTGLRVQAWDFSGTAIARLEAEVARRGISSLQPEVRDVIASPPGPDTFDVITVGYFLERSLAPVLVEALRADGLLFYQTYTRTAVSALGPSDPLFRLEDNELLRLFSELKVRVYREEGRLGDLSRGCRDVAMLVAQKCP